MAFFSWAARRQLIILGLVVVVLAVPISYAIFSYLYEPPSCFDRKQNQGEFGPDCGGPCTALCSSQVTDPIILWARAFKVRGGIYDVAALVENPNSEAGVKEIPYVFKMYDNANFVIAEREGKTYINPNEQFVIYEPGIETGERTPVRTFFEFRGDLAWVKTHREKPSFFSKNTKLQDIETRPRLRAEITNTSLIDAQKIIVVVLLFDRNDNAVAVGKTEIDFLEKDEIRDITFTWPAPFEKKPEVCTEPLDIMLVFDRSGSMNDDESNPPQPLTDAQAAAEDFINALSNEDKVGVVSFATNASVPLDQELSYDHARTKSALGSITILPEEEEGFTNLGDGLDKALRELQSVRQSQNAKKIAIVLTDGRANAPKDPGGELYAELFARNAREDKIITYVIGLGDAVNASFLSEKIASEKNKYYAAPSRSDLSRIYKDIAQVVCPERTYPITIFPRTNIVGNTP